MVPLLNTTSYVFATQVADTLNDYNIPTIIRNEKDDVAQVYISWNTTPSIIIYVDESNLKQARKIVAPLQEKREKQQHACPSCGSLNIHRRVDKDSHNMVYSVICYISAALAILGFMFSETPYQYYVVAFFALIALLTFLKIIFSQPKNYECLDCGKKFN